MRNLKSILGVVFVEKNEKRIISNYNENGSLKEYKSQRELEQMTVKILNNYYTTEKGVVDIFLILEKMVMVRAFSDFYLIIVSENNENEMVLNDLIETIEVALEYFCSKDVSLKSIYRHYEEIVLLINEVFSNGLILTSSSQDLISRINLTNAKKGKTPATPNQGKSGVMGFLGFS